jgi:hypothetical protein|tara:strand:+ start:662 stop:892 length:231 start_codon:yes stop_codon:yes gene_type:complete
MKTVKNATDWKRTKDWKFPYIDRGLYGTLKDPNYIDSRNKLFEKHGNGWWWGNGWWNGKHISLMERQRTYRKNKNG